MTTLHDRLTDLADHADEVRGGAPASDLWSTGRRVHRRRRVGTIAVTTVAVAVLAGLGGVTWSRGAVDVEPAAPTTELGMPDRLYAPSEHLPGTDDSGPIGPLSVVVTAENGRALGISATGEYAYLDVPRWSSMLTSGPVDPAISADGRLMAYWRTGTPTGDPGGLPEDVPTAGVSVYDTVTGEVWDYPVATEHGLQPQELLWVGDRIWFEVYQLDPPTPVGEGYGSNRTEVVAWNPATDDVTTWDNRESPPSTFRGSAWGDRLLTVGFRGRLLAVSTQGKELVARLADAAALQSAPYVDARGTRIAGIGLVGEETGEGGPVVLGALPSEAGGAMALTTVPGTDEQPVDEILGWRDDRHVVAARYGTGGGYVSIDLQTGDSTRLTRQEGNPPTFAADALKGPVFDAPRPPEPVNPALVKAGVAGTLLVAGGALFWWRRRVQR
jgi:hypothetical protein